MIFKFDADQGTLVPNEPAFAQVKPGAGPRHIAFHPNGRWAYVINEMASTITVFGLRRAAARCGKSKPFHPPGRFFRPEHLRGSGGASLGQICLWLQSGRRQHRGVWLRPGERVADVYRTRPTGGKTPRQFEIDPTGRYLLAANQNSNTVVVFRIDAASGRLQPAGSQVQSDNPMCVRCVLEPP
jgi:6-phosphogluconolactonase